MLERGTAGVGYGGTESSPGCQFQWPLLVEPDRKPAVQNGNWQSLVAKLSGKLGLELENQQTQEEKKKKKEKKKCWRGCREREPSHTVDGNVNWCNHYVEQYGGSLKKNRCRSTIWSSNPSPGHTFRENCNSKRHMYPSVHCSTIYNSQDMKAN